MTEHTSPATLISVFDVIASLEDEACRHLDLADEADLNQSPVGQIFTRRDMVERAWALSAFASKLRGGSPLPLARQDPGWQLACHLLKQIESEDAQCAFWVISALQKFTSAGPMTPVATILQEAIAAMPLAANEYCDYAMETR